MFDFGIHHMHSISAHEECMKYRMIKIIQPIFFGKAADRLERRHLESCSGVVSDQPLLLKTRGLPVHCVVGSRVLMSQLVDEVRNRRNYSAIDKELWNNGGD